MLRLEILEGREVPAGIGLAQLLSSAYPAPVTVQAASSAAAPLAFYATRLARANWMVSTFENSTLTLQWGYIENLNDGRGFTAGRVGFTTATGDLLLVIERYTKLNPGNSISRYLPRLRELAATGSDSTVGLAGFEAIWKKAATAYLFRVAQNQIANELYLIPATQQARAIGAKNYLTLAALYDTGIQHGHGDDPDGLPAIITRTNLAVGGTPSTGADERTWLARFLDEREATLNDPANDATRDAWRESVDRVHVLRGFLQAGNVNFDGPLNYTVYGDAFVVP